MFQKNNDTLLATVLGMLFKKLGFPLIQDWCFQNKIQNAPFDCVLVLLQYGGSTKTLLCKIALSSIPVFCNTMTL